MNSNVSVTTLFARCADNWPATHTPLHLYALSLHRLAAWEAARTEKMVKAHGLTLTEFDLLATLRRAAPPHVLNPTVLQRSTLLSSGGLTKILYQMEERDLISRSVAEDDKRSRLVHLTATGKAVVERAMTEVLAFKTQATAATGLTSDELAQLNTLLSKLLSPLEAAQ